MLRSFVVKIGFFAAFWLLAGTVAAQFSNLRAKFADARLPAQRLDSLTVASPLLSVTDITAGKTLDQRFFGLRDNWLLIDTAALLRECPNCAQLMVRYRVLPFHLGAPTARLDSANLRRRLYADAIEFDYEPYQPGKNIWEQGGIASSGAYTRGLSFGNSQNLVFNSNLNLQLNGTLGNDLELNAALTDNSIPLQPDGTTRQLQEFDRIFIELKRRDLSLSAGDIDLVRPKGYFSNYFKRLQGGLLKFRPLAPNAPTSGWATGGNLGAGISRGKFARQLIQGQEGNQGPYRLQGAEGERFIIVIAGTEKVFADGQLLQRGLEDDYTIDYNLGELVFTPRRLITKDIRIIVEFEYAVQTYLRSTATAHLYAQNKRALLYLNLYSEQDSRNNGGAQALSSAERARLAQIGDDLRNAFAPGIDTLSSFDPNRVLYRALDTVICGLPRQVLVFSTDPATARFAARFTEVPAGQGNYVLAQTAANGRVFRFSPPDPLTCQPTGNFEPIVKLTAPETRQLYAFGGEWQTSARSNLQAELALSNRDLNRFSPVGNGDNLGKAATFGWQLRPQNTAPPEKNADGWGARALYEYTDRNFRPLNPYRAPEFVRDWSLAANADTTAEHLAKAGVSYTKQKIGEARYDLGLFQREGAYKGLRHFGQLRAALHGWALTGEVNDLQTFELLQNTRFSRPKADLSKTFFSKKDSTGQLAVFKVGLYAEREKNASTALASDSLTAASFWYDLLRLYFQKMEANSSWQWGGHLSQRHDFAPNGQFFRQNTLANDFNLNGAWNNALARVVGAPPPAVGQQLSWVLHYRRLQVPAPELTKEKPQETYLGRVDYNLTAWKNALAFNTAYEIGSGQSPRIEFTYLPVNPGQGQYTWVDRNRDSIIQLDEMELAVFQDQANYVRVAVTTPDYVRTNNVSLNQTLRFEPRHLWPAAKRGWRRRLARLSTQSTLQTARRSFANAEGLRIWDPFQTRVADTALAALSAAQRHILFVNRAQPKWDASLSAADNRSQVALTTGFEQRRALLYSLHLRSNLSQQWSLEADVEFGEKNSQNQAFASRNYRLDVREWGPKLTWLPQRGLRALVEMRLESAVNTLPGAERARKSNWTAELIWNPSGQANRQGFRAATSLRLKGTFAQVRYTGAPNTAVSFAMLEGLQDGKNYLWSAALDRQLSKTMQINLNYEGRKTGDGRTVHVARAQVRAVF